MNITAPPRDALGRYVARPDQVPGQMAIDDPCWRCQAATQMECRCADLYADARPRREEAR